MIELLQSVTASDVAIVVATLIGPILAVQAQKWLERRRQIEERRLSIFRTLMSTRATKLSPAHVEALNAVPVEFYGTSGKLIKINEAWKLYLDHLDPGNVANETWAQKRDDLFVDLIYNLSQSLGYKFNKSQIGRDIYYPKAYGDIELENSMVRQGLVRIITGESALPMAIKEFPNQNTP